MMPRSGDNIWGEKCDMNVFSSGVLPLRPQEFPLALLPDVFTCNVLLSKMELSAWTANIRLFWRNRIYAPKKTSQPFRTRGKTELEKSLPSWVRWLMLSLMFYLEKGYSPKQWLINMLMWVCSCSPLVEAWCSVINTCIFPCWSHVINHFNFFRFSGGCLVSNIVDRIFVDMSKTTVNILLFERILHLNSICIYLDTCI